MTISLDFQMQYGGWQSSWKSRLQQRFIGYSKADRIFWVWEVSLIISLAFKSNGAARLKAVLSIILAVTHLTRLIYQTHYLYHCDFDRCYTTFSIYEQVDQRLFLTLHGWIGTGLNSLPLRQTESQKDLCPLCSMLNPQINGMSWIYSLAQLQVVEQLGM